MHCDLMTIPITLQGDPGGGGGHSIVLDCWVCHYMCLFFTFSLFDGPVSSHKDF